MRETRRRLGGCAVRVMVVALAWTVLACSDQRAREPGASEVGDGGADAAARVKERTVAITLPPVARRSFGPGPDGGFDFGEIEMLDGAESCVVQRREAFATFEPFEAIPRAAQRCVTTGAGEDVRIEGVPASSDLVITVTKAGFMPGLLTFRVETLDVPKAFWVGDLVTVLFEPGQGDPWLESPTGTPRDAGIVTLHNAVSWGGPGLLAFPRVNLSTATAEGAGWIPAEGTHVTVEPSAGSSADPIEVTPTTAQPAFLALRPGLHRFVVTHPRARCEPSGVLNGYTPWGLSGDLPGELEMPVLAGHYSQFAANCWCFPPRADAVPLDLASCTFAEDGGAP